MLPVIFVFFDVYNIGDDNIKENPSVSKYPFDLGGQTHPLRPLAMKNKCGKDCFTAENAERAEVTKN
jgi:hypothetical protein